MEKCCRTCEYWDGGGEVAAKTALTGDCHNPNSDRFTPEWDHVCKAYLANTWDSAEVD